MPDPTPPDHVYAEMLAAINVALSPVLETLKHLTAKVDALTSDHVTRADIDQLRRDISQSFVQNAVLEPRLLGIVDRVDRLERTVKENKQTLEDRIKESDQQTLSDQDRAWLRFSQVSAYVAIVVSIIGFLIQHLRFQ